jgi:hypothetical protein
VTRTNNIQGLPNTIVPWPQDWDLPVTLIIVECRPASYHLCPLQPFFGPWPLFQFLNLFTQSVGLLGWVISPSQGRYVHTGQHKHRINIQTSMAQMWFEPTIPVFERAKTIHALDRAAQQVTIAALIYRHISTQHLLQDNYVYFHKHLTSVFNIFGPLNEGWCVLFGVQASETNYGWIKRSGVVEWWEGNFTAVTVQRASENILYCLDFFSSVPATDLHMRLVFTRFNVQLYWKHWHRNGEGGTSEAFTPSPISIFTLLFLTLLEHRAGFSVSWSFYRR